MRDIIRAYGRLQAAFADETARFFMDVSLTMAQFRALAAVRQHGRLSGRELARQVRVTPGTLIPLIDRLEEQGYLRRVPDHVDRRLTWLEVTPKGNRLFHRLWLSGAGKMLRAVGRLSPSDRTTLKRLLQEIAVELEGTVERQPSRDAASRAAVTSLAAD